MWSVAAEALPIPGHWPTRRPPGTPQPNAAATQSLRALVFLYPDAPGGWLFPLVRLCTEDLELKTVAYFRPEANPYVVASERVEVRTERPGAFQDLANHERLAGHELANEEDAQDDDW